jgi:hypothetical protein
VWRSLTFIKQKNELKKYWIDTWVLLTLFRCSYRAKSTPLIFTHNLALLWDDCTIRVIYRFPWQWVLQDERKNIQFNINQRGSFSRHTWRMTCQSPSSLWTIGSSHLVPATSWQILLSLEAPVFPRTSNGGPSWSATPGIRADIFVQFCLPASHLLSDANRPWTSLSISWPSALKLSRAKVACID